MTDQPSPTSPKGSPPNFSFFTPRRSAGMKLLLVCALAVLMIIPALLVYGVVHERSSGLQLAITEVGESVGGQQTVLGPVLAVPYSQTPDPNKPDSVVYGMAIAFAETGAADANVSVEERRRGIHTIPVFDAMLGFSATFDPGALRRAIPANAEAIWGDARLYTGVSDTRGIKDVIHVTANGQTIAMEPTNYRASQSGYDAVPYAGVVLAGGRIPNLANEERLIEVTASLHLTGAQRLAVGPFAKDTRFDMVSNWPSPSFGGGVLPDAHNIGDGETGFEAEWRVPYMARGIAGAGANLDLQMVTQWNNRDMAVRFIKEASPYQSVERALKYAAMFIGFVFLAYFLFEITSGARAHPAQYVLVGLAQSIFYLLLLSFSERVGFDFAFIVAAIMTVGLTSYYAMSVFKSRQYGLRALGVMSGIYTLIYILMRAEGHALLAGAVASFVAIALTMYMTRDVDWYGSQND